MFLFLKMRKGLREDSYLTLELFYGHVLSSLLSLLVQCFDKIEK